MVLQQTRKQLLPGAAKDPLDQVALPSALDADREQAYAVYRERTGAAGSSAPFLLTARSPDARRSLLHVRTIHAARARFASWMVPLSRLTYAARNR